MKNSRIIRQIRSKDGASLKRIIFCLIFFSIVNFFNKPLLAEFGIKVGISKSFLISSIKDHKPFLGYEIDSIQSGKSVLSCLQIGIFNSFRISNHFEFQPELYYSTRGRNFCMPYIYDNLKIKIKYLELPLLLKFKFPIKIFFTSVLFIGPFVALKIGAKKVINIWGKEKETTNLGNIKTFNYGFVFGTGTEFKLLSEKLILDFHVNLGLANIMTRPEEYRHIKSYYYKGSEKDLSLIFSIGYRF